MLFVFSPAGDEISWLSPTMGLWYGNLLLRDTQYRDWLKSGRPHSFWMAGMFNPQGFLTAVQQEITRAHKAESWALDSVVLHAEVTDITNHETIKTNPKVILSSTIYLFVWHCIIELILSLSDVFIGGCLCSWSVLGWRCLEPI
jgi:hypothetical protein